MLPRVRGSIALRRLVPDDLEDFQAYRTDPEVGRYQSWSCMSNEQASEFLRDVGSGLLLQPGRWTQIAIANVASGRLMGDIGIIISDDASQAELGFTLGRQHQGCGFARQAVLEAIELVLSHTAIQRIVAITDQRNIQSIRLLERIGMSLEATTETTFRGEPCIEQTYSLARLRD